MFWNNNDDEFIIIRRKRSGFNRFNNYGNSYPFWFVLLIVLKIIKWLLIVLAGLFIFRKATSVFNSFMYRLQSFL